MFLRHAKFPRFPRPQGRGILETRCLASHPHRHRLPATTNSVLSVRSGSVEAPLGTSINTSLKDIKSAVTWSAMKALPSSVWLGADVRRWQKVAAFSVCMYIYIYIYIYIWGGKCVCVCVCVCVYVCACVRQRERESMCVFW